MAKPMTTKDKIREWISDNLRYILLICAIALVVGIILLIVHLIGAGSDAKKEQKNTAVTVSSSQNTAEKNNSQSHTESSVSDSGTAAESTPSAENKEESQPLTADNETSVSDLIRTYYTALAAKDIEGILAVSDQLTEEEQAQIEAEQDVEGYENVQTYTLSGPSEGTYVALVRYACKYQGIDQTLPMLSEFYLYQKEDGTLTIQDDTDNDPAASQAMQDVLEQEEVKNLIAEVQTEYENALNADAQLKAYVESIQ